MKSEYSNLLNGEAESDDEMLTQPVPRPNKSVVWKRRFYFLLTSFLSLGSGLLIGGAYQRHYITCPSPPLSDGSNTVFDPEVPQLIRPYCECHTLFPPLLALPSVLTLCPIAAPAPIRYINKFLKNGPDSKPFMGHPRPELDQAWHELLTGTLVRFSADELHLANYSTSIRHKEGGYIGGLGIAHNLHCLVRASPPLAHYPSDALPLTFSRNASSNTSTPTTTPKSYMCMKTPGSTSTTVSRACGWQSCATATRMSMPCSGCLTTGSSLPWCCRSRMSVWIGSRCISGC